MSNSSGTVFAGGLRQGDPGPLGDEMAGGNDAEQCASALVDMAGAGAGSPYALLGFYRTPNTAEGIGSPLHSRHLVPTRH